MQQRPATPFSHLFSALKNKAAAYFMPCCVLLFLAATAHSQVRVEFQPRTSALAQNRSIYNIRGDYTMIGNTNMTRTDNSSGDNSNASMSYINVDRSNQRLNSSSAELQFVNGDGADPACTRVVYAGLYWTGRAHDANTSDHTFSVTKNIRAGTPTALNSTATFTHNADITNTDYKLIISRQGGLVYTMVTSRVLEATNQYCTRYTFTGAGGAGSVWIDFLNNAVNGSRLRYSTNGGTTWNPIPATVTTSGNVATATINPVFTLFNDTGIGTAITLNQIRRDSRTGTTYTANNQDVRYLINGAGQTTITTNGTINIFYPRYTLLGTAAGLPTIDIEFLNNNNIRYRMNSGAWTNAPANTQTAGTNIRTATFSPEFSITNADGTNLAITAIRRDSRTDQAETQYQNTTNNYVTIHATGTYRPLTAVTTTLDKHVVQLKHASATSYTQIVAAASNFTTNIYYPTNSDGYMYSAYADVTDYVKQYGVGNYTVADIALREGNGGGTGFYGGWGMVVVYENSLMKWRDIAVFDGHAFVAAATVGTLTSYNLPVSGFHAVQQGPVNVKLGVMAGEGDQSIAGDIFGIYNQTSGAYNNLSHGGNTANNFFNSSVYTGGNARNPNLSNNTGLDISMFEIDNAGKQYITNDQTSTTFRYGSTQDTYAIFCIVVGIDAYIPEPEIESASISIKDKNGIPVAPIGGQYTVEPGARIDYAFYVRNKSPEGIDNIAVNFPLPYTTRLVNATHSYSGIAAGTFSYDQAVGPSGTITWTVGNIPKSSAMYPVEHVYATLHFTLEVVDDCNILYSSGACVPGVTIGGAISGVGHDTGIPFSGLNFVYGFQTDCAGTPITEPPTVNINPGVLNCGPEYATRTIITCTQGTTVPYNVVADNFQTGTRFYNTIDASTGKPPVTATEYTAATGFPTATGATYYAVPSSFLNTCYWSFKLQVNSPPSFTVSTDKICQGTDKDLRTLVNGITPAGSAVKFYSNAGATDEIDPIVSPATSITYYVRSYSTGYACNSAISPLVLTVDARATANDITANSISICTGTAATLTASSATAAPVYRWFTSQTEAAPVHEGASFTTGILTATLTRDTTFYVSVHGLNVCENLPGARKAVTVKINQMPVAKIQTPADTANICHNALTELSVDVPGCIWVGWYDRNNKDNSAQFAPVWFTAYPPAGKNTVFYHPDVSEAGSISTIRVSVNTGVCGYVYDNIRLNIQPKPTRAEFELMAQPHLPQDLCTDTVYEVKIKSADLGALHNMQLKLHDINVNGVNIKSARMKQPYMSPGWEDLTNVISADLTGKAWQLPRPLAGGDSILVQITVSAECGFFSGTGVNLNLSSRSSCGDVLPMAVLSSEPFNTTQDLSLVNTYTMVSKFSVGSQSNVDKLTNATGDTVTWRLKAIVHGNFPTNSDKESFAILVPKGLNPVFGSFTPIYNWSGVVNHLDTLVDENGREFSMSIPAGVMPGDSVIMELKFHASGSPCQNYNFYAEAIYSDDAFCGTTSCSVNATRGGIYPTLDVERYAYTPVNTVPGRIVDDLWYGAIEIRAGTEFFAGDSVFIDFYADDNTDFVPDAGELVREFTRITAATPVNGSFSLQFDSVPVRKEKQLLAVIHGKTLCSTSVLPIVTLAGADTLCQADTAVYYSVPGMTAYKWNYINVDGLTGATPQYVGSNNQSTIAIVWPKNGNFTLWSQYSVPAGGGLYTEIGKTDYPLHVNERPLLQLVAAADTAICEGSRVELSHFFRDISQLPETDVTFEYYRKESDGKYTLLSGNRPFYVEPWETTVYRAAAVCASTGCTSSNPVDFTIHVNKMPQIASIGVNAPPTCGNSNGSIRLSVAGGSGSYQYSLNSEAAYDDLPASGIIRNLPAGNYTVYLKDKTRPGCTASISAPVSLNPVSGMFVTATATDAPSCSGNGSISVIASGGQSPYQYSINGGAYAPLPTTASAHIGNFPTGRYKISVKDADNCVAADAVTVNAAVGLTVSLSQKAAAGCKTQGLAMLGVSGGTAPYSYRIGGKGRVDMTANPDSLLLDAGLHQIFVKDATGCETSSQIGISGASTLTASIDAVTMAACNGASPGNIRINANGGTGQLKYSIDGGRTYVNIAAGAVTIPNVPVGSHQILLTDDAGCIFVLEGIETGVGEYDFINAGGNRLITYRDVPVAGYVIHNDFDYLHKPLSLKNQIHEAKHGDITEFNPVTFRVGYTPFPDFTGTDSVQYTVVNACGMERNVWLTIDVLDTVVTNRPPLALDDWYGLQKGSVLTDFEVRNNDSSFGNGTLTNPSTVTPPKNGTLTQKPDGTFTYTPYPNHVGTDVFAYSVCDENGLCDEAQVYLAVYESGVYADSVLAVPDAYRTAKYDTLKISGIAEGVLGNDSYPAGAPAVTVLTGVQHGTLDMNVDGSFTYTPDTGFAGTDVFLYRVCVAAKCDVTYASIFVTERPCPVRFATKDTIPVCSGDSVTLISAITAPTANANIDTVSFFADRDHLIPVTDPYAKTQGDYYISVKSTYGCEVSDSVYIKILPSPAPVIDNAADRDCTGNRILFSTADSPGDTYLWAIVSGGGGAMEGAGTGHLEYFTWTADGTKEVSVTVTGVNGCANTATKTILIEARPETGPIYRLPNK